MYRIDNSTAVATAPSPAAAGPVVNGHFTGGVPLATPPVPPTTVDSDWAESVQEEICHVVEAYGATLNKTNHTQLYMAISGAIAAETTRAEGAEAALSSAISSEAGRAEGAEAALSSAISSEAGRAQGAEAALSAAISNEASRAQGVEETKAPISSPTFTNNAGVQGSFTITNLATGQSGGFQCVEFGSPGTAPAISCDVGLVGGPTGFTATTGCVLNAGGLTNFSSFSGQFGFMTGYNSQAIAYYSTSDGRLKHDKETITPEQGLEFLFAVHPVFFRWNRDCKRGVGYIAQQLIAAGYDHLVSVVANDDLVEEKRQFGDSTVLSPAGVQLLAKYDDTIAYLHAAILGAVEMIKGQGARIAALESRIAQI